MCHGPLEQLCLIPCICMGDFNSVASLDLDVWHGSHVSVRRPSLLTMPSFDCVACPDCAFSWLSVRPPLQAALQRLVKSIHCPSLRGASCLQCCALGRRCGPDCLQLPWRPAPWLRLFPAGLNPKLRPGGKRGHQPTNAKCRSHKI